MDAYIKREDALDAVLFALAGTGVQSRALRALHELPAIEVEMLFFDLKQELYSKFPYKTRPIQMGGRCMGNSYEMGQEKMLYEVLELIDDLEKKYTEARNEHTRCSRTGI